MLEDHSHRYFNAMKARGYSPKTVQIHEVALEQFAEYLRDNDRSLEVSTITRDDLESYRGHLVKRDLATSTLDMYLRSLRRFFGWLSEEQVLFDNPARSLLIPKVRRKLLPVPTKEEMLSLLSGIPVGTALGIRDRALLEVAYATGVRRSELLALTHFDVDPQASHRKMKKGLEDIL